MKLTLLVLLFSVSTAFAASPIKKLALGWEHTCALFENGKVKCWGKNLNGELGLGDTKPRGLKAQDLGANLPFVKLGTNRLAKDIAASSYATCVVLDDNSVKCWGRNEVGQLGLGDTKPRGISVNEMGDALPKVNLGKSPKVTSIVAGGYHFCALFEDGKFKCWGENANAQLGLGHTDAGYGSDKQKMGDNLPFVNMGAQVSVEQLALGWSHSCALLKSKRVKCWGFKYYAHGTDSNDNIMTMGDELPELKLDYTKPIVKIAGKGGHTCVTSADEVIRCWGYNGSGQLGNGISDSLQTYEEAKPVLLGDLEAIDLAIGGISSCAVIANATVKCWADNSYGQIGIEDTRSRGNDPKDMGEYLRAIDLGNLYSARSVYCSGWHSCAILNDEKFQPTRVKCWGLNDSGQLGAGDNIRHGGSIGTMGEKLPDVDLE